MTIGRRYELLMCVAARNIPEKRRKELLDLAQAWLASQECTVRNHEELFYMWGAMAGMQIANYSEDLQARWGAEILEKEMGLPKV